MESVLLLHSNELGRSLKRLASHGYNIVDYSVEDLQRGDLHGALKNNEIIIICSKPEQTSKIADEIWHLLRKKYVMSLSKDLEIASLRNQYPLSKVCRFAFCIEADVDKSLIFLSPDNTLSGDEINRIQSMLGSLGEVLQVNEQLLDSLTGSARVSAAVISSLVEALTKASGHDSDLFEYILGWVLYGVGDAAINGIKIGDLLPKSTDIAVRTILDEATREAFKKDGKR